MARLRPAAGSMTYGKYRSFASWSKYFRSWPEASLCTVRS